MAIVKSEKEWGVYNMNLEWFYNKDAERSVPFLYLNEPYRVNDIGNGPDERFGIRMTEEDAEEWFSATLDELSGLVYPVTQRLDLAKLILDNGGTLEIGNARGGDMGLHVRGRRTADYPLTWESNGEGAISGSIEFIHNEELLAEHVRYNQYSVYHNNTSDTFMLVRDYTSTVRLVRLGYVLAHDGDIDVTYYNWGGHGDYDPGTSTESRQNNLLSIPADVWYLFNSTKDKPIEEEKGIIDMYDRYAPRTGANGIGVYPLTQQQVGEFTSDLWTKTFLEAISELVNGSPMESIISLRWFYGIKASLPVSADHFYVTLGNTPFNGLLTESSIVTKPVASEMMTYSMGYVEVPRKYNNFLDLEPFTKMQLYIPYVGYVNLNTTEFIGKRIRLEYNINLVTGATVALVYVDTGTNSWRVMSEYPTVTGVEIPLTVNARESISLRMATTMAGIGATGAGAALGSVAGPMGAAVGASVGNDLAGAALNSFSNGISSMSNPGGGAASRNGGGMDSETGSLSDFTPHVLLSRPQAIAPPEYNDNIGTPDFRNVIISNMSGYFKISAFNKRNDNSEAFSDAIPREAFNEIEQILRTGVYMQ